MLSPKVTPIAKFQSMSYMCCIFVQANTSIKHKNRCVSGTASLRLAVPGCCLDVWCPCGAVLGIEVLSQGYEESEESRLGVSK